MGKGDCLGGDGGRRPGTLAVSSKTCGASPVVVARAGRPRGRWTAVLEGASLKSRARSPRVQGRGGPAWPARPEASAGGSSSSAVSHAAAASVPSPALGSVSPSRPPSGLRRASGARGDRRRLVLHGPARRSGCAADAQPTSRSCGRSVHAALPRAGAHTHAASRFHNVQRIGKLSAGGFHVGHEV